ncbi:MAG: GNAT family N-acetyltransferase [Bacilli bacterium]
MIRIEENEYFKINKLINKNNELSVYSLLDLMVRGEIYVDNEETPQSALIKTPECNYLIGEADNVVFNKEVKEKLDFWDTITFDSDDYEKNILYVHPNKKIRKYTRLRFCINPSKVENGQDSVLSGYKLEIITKELLEKSYDNKELITDWINNYKNEDMFFKYGFGVAIIYDNAIVAASLTDCFYRNKISIGMKVEEKHRKKGLGKLCVRKMIEIAKERQIDLIDWLCVSQNKGSIALATSCGFYFSNFYYSFASYAPIENLSDLTNLEWNEWGNYFYDASKEEPKLFDEAVYAYCKAHNYSRVSELLAVKNNSSFTEYIKKFMNYLDGLNKD